MIEGALVLEGGSLRSAFTAGVLDVFIENEIELSYVNGVSAGAMCAINYLSKQVGRTITINQDYLHDKRYVSFRNLLKNRLIFNFDFLFGELSESLVPLDRVAFEQSAQRFVVAATRCKTGKPEFFEKGFCEDIFQAVRASASLPVLSRMVTMEGKQYLDGGISLPIAYHQALEERYEKVVLVLTRQAGYQKPPMDQWHRRGYQNYFAPLPELFEALAAAPERYNQMQQEIAQLEKEGRIYVIRPEFPVQVSRVEQNKKKIEALYQEGRRIASLQLADLVRYLEC